MCVPRTGKAILSMTKAAFVLLNSSTRSYIVATFSQSAHLAVQLAGPPGELRVFTSSTLELFVDSGGSCGQNEQRRLL